MSDEKESDSNSANKIGFYYQRSRHYRTIHADGAQFGVTPRGAVQFTLFSDQKPMPEFELHRVTPEGNIGEVIEQVTKQGAVIREVEVNIVMDVPTITEFLNALQKVLAQIKSIQEQAERSAKANQQE